MTKNLRKQFRSLLNAIFAFLRKIVESPIERDPEEEAMQAEDSYAAAAGKL